MPRDVILPTMADIPAEPHTMVIFGRVARTCARTAALLDDGAHISCRQGRWWEAKIELTIRGETYGTALLSRDEVCPDTLRLVRLDTENLRDDPEYPGAGSLLLLGLVSILATTGFQRIRWKSSGDAYDFYDLKFRERFAQELALVGLMYSSDGSYFEVRK